LYFFPIIRKSQTFFTNTFYPLHCSEIFESNLFARSIASEFETKLKKSENKINSQNSYSMYDCFFLLSFLASRVSSYVFVTQNELCCIFSVCFFCLEFCVTENLKFHPKCAAWHLVRSSRKIFVWKIGAVKLPISLKKLFFNKKQPKNKFVITPMWSLSGIRRQKLIFKNF